MTGAGGWITGPDGIAYGPFGETYNRGEPARALPPPIRAHESIVLRTTAHTFADDVPVRAATCLVCGHEASWRPVRQVVILHHGQDPCGCGNTCPAGFVVHVTCADINDRDLVTLASAKIDYEHRKDRTCPSPDS